MTGLKMGAHSNVSVDEARREQAQKEHGPFSEKVTTNYSTDTGVFHKAVAHAGIRGKNAALVLWGSLPLNGGNPTVGITASCTF
jgi:hypothetical protein